MLGAGFVADKHAFADYVKALGFADRAKQFHFRNSVRLALAFLSTDEQPCVSLGVVKFFSCWSVEFDIS